MEPYLLFSPVIETKFDENVFLADYPDNILNNITTTVPLIIGTNKDEGMFFLSGEYLNGHMTTAIYLANSDMTIYFILIMDFFKQR